MTDRFLYTLPTDPVALPLVEQLTDEYQTRYGNYFEEGGAVQEMNRYPAERFAAPDGAFVLLLRNERPIAGGAFMRYDETTAEFKRVWTDKDFRRQGLAKRVLVELEEQAIRQGYERVYLTTGYSALFDLEANPEDIQILAFEKALTASAGVLAARNSDAQVALAQGK